VVQPQIPLIKRPVPSIGSTNQKRSAFCITPDSSPVNPMEGSIFLRLSAKNTSVS